MFVNLYQIADELDSERMMFRDFKTIMNTYENKFPKEIYKLVFSGELDVQDPEDVFYIFNTAHPENYSGRSMSVSDVVEFVHTPAQSDFYFCDSVGFKQVEFNK